MQLPHIERIEELYGRYRTDTSPLHREWLGMGPVLVDADGKIVVVGHADARAALTDPAISVDMRDSRWYQERAAAGEVPEEEQQRYVDPPFVELNPPEHTRHRLPVGQAFAARAAKAGEAIQRVVDERLELLSSTTECDVVQDFAYTVPIRVLCELFDISDDNDRQRVQDWSHFISRSMDPSNPVDPAEVERVSQEFRGYLSRLVDERAARGGDDIVNTMLGGGANGAHGLSKADVVNALWLLLVSGHETTSSLIASGLYSLVTDPSLATRMADSPESMPGLVDELLRLTPLVQFLWRHVKVDMTLPSGAQLTAGDTVVVVVAAANRDPDHFRDPDVLDPNRTEQHLSFGAGPHYCLGATLARLQANIALTTFLRRIAHPQVAAQPGSPLALGGLTSLRIKHAVALAVG
jgi:cytochrome P450